MLFLFFRKISILINIKLIITTIKTINTNVALQLYGSQVEKIKKWNGQQVRPSGKP